MNNLYKILKTLSEAKVDFVLIGGLAAVVHGSAYVTRDVDVCLLLTPENIQKLRTCLAPFNPKHRMTPQKLSFLDFPEYLTGIKNLYVQCDLGTLDLLGNVPGVGTFDEIKSRANEIDVEGLKIKVISIDDLIKSKKIVGRPKDHATILELNVIQEKMKKKPLRQ